MCAVEIRRGIMSPWYDCRTDVGGWDTCIGGKWSSNTKAPATLRITPRATLVCTRRAPDHPSILIDGFAAKWCAMPLTAHNYTRA